MLLWEPPKHSLLYLKSDRSLSKNLHSVIVFKHESHQDSPSAPGKRPAYPSCSSQLQQQTSPGVKKTRGDFTPDSWIRREKKHVWNSHRLTKQTKHTYIIYIYISHLKNFIDISASINGTSRKSSFVRYLRHPWFPGQRRPSTRSIPKSSPFLWLVYKTSPNGRFMALDFHGFPETCTCRQSPQVAFLRHIRRLRYCRWSPDPLLMNKELPEMAVPAE